MQEEFDDAHELSDISAYLSALARQIAESPEYGEVERIEKVVSVVEKAFSKSCMGYHACIYFKDFHIPPAGMHFDTVSGIGYDVYGSRRNWVEYAPDEVKRYILSQSGEPDIHVLKKYEQDIRNKYERYRSEAISLLSQEIYRHDNFLGNQLKEIQSKKILSTADIRNAIFSGRIMTQDYKAVSQGPIVPPHIQLLSDIIPIKYVMNGCLSLSQICDICSSHVARKQKRMKHTASGSKIFIGHGGSPLWRDLKDFLADRLGLPWEEFNRTSPAGMATTERLSEMLDNAAFAFLIMTAEDERADGSVQARMNVIHEAGLFQGRLGFRKAIILLESGCEEFSNIKGLGQIRFPQGDIRYKFEEIREVLEREQII